MVDMIRRSIGRHSRRAGAGGLMIVPGGGLSSWAQAGPVNPGKEFVVRAPAAYRVPSISAVLAPTGTLQRGIGSTVSAAGMEGADDGASNGAEERHGA